MLPLSFFLVVTGASDGIGKGYALEVRKLKIKADHEIFLECAMTLYNGHTCLNKKFQVALIICSPKSASTDG